MAKKTKARFEDAKEPSSRSFAMMSHTMAEAWANSSASRSRGVSTALSAKSGLEIVSKAEIRQEQARRVAEKPTSRLEDKSSGARHSGASEVQLEKCPQCGRPVNAKKLRKHLVGCSGGPNKRRFDGQPRFHRGSNLSQGGLPTLGKRR